MITPSPTSNTGRSNNPGAARRLHMGGPVASSASPVSPAVLLPTSAVHSRVPVKGAPRNETVDTAKLAAELRGERSWQEEQARAEGEAFQESLERLRGLAAELDASDWMFAAGNEEDEAR